MGKLIMFNFKKKQTLAAMLCGSLDGTDDFGLDFLVEAVHCLFRACMVSPCKKKKLVAISNS